MTKQIFISSSVLLRHNQVIVDGEVVYENKEVSELDFLPAAYSHFQINYPKFFKMDNLCKAGFLASELLLHPQHLGERYQAEETGIIFSTANSSLDTDLKYETSIAIAPSPSLFVYTLPNVLIGEICIRHRIKGEAACFVFDIFDPSFQSDYVNSLFETEKVKTVVSGWADCYNGKAEAFFYLAETGKENLEIHNSSNVHKIFQGI